MKLTTKGRYAVMAMADMAINNKNLPINLSTIAANQNIDVQYLEKIFNSLKRNGLVTSIKGPGGGYILADNLSKISILRIINAADENVVMTICSKKEVNCTKTSDKCLTHSLWADLTIHINNYLSSISLADICNRKIIT